jgi:hypothetical protein
MECVSGFEMPSRMFFRHASAIFRGKTSQITRACMYPVARTREREGGAEAGPTFECNIKYKSKNVVLVGPELIRMFSSSHPSLKSILLLK